MIKIKYVWLSVVIAFFVASIFFMGGCSALPSLENRTTSTLIFDTADTQLGKAISPQVAAHPGKSGIYPLQDAQNAFAARMLLAQTAERTLDIQYYIWHKDMTGTLLFDALRRAADRGVRVRLLLDDNNTSDLDATLAALDAHPNIEVRLFNPFIIRSPRWVGYLTDFRRLNRRMHNKSFTADNQATVIGGRNIGDEYFGAIEGKLFVDLDVIAVGPVVTDVSNDFDRYWASASSYPVDRILPSTEPEHLAELTALATQIEHNTAARAYINVVRNSAFVSELLHGTLKFEWAATRMVSDDPAKGLGLAKPEMLLSQKLRTIIGDPTSNANLISAYFVPTETGLEMFTDMAKRGVKIRILTNSFEATDVGVVHAGYIKRRKPLLKAGAILYERKRASSDERQPKVAGVMGSSSTSLHAKTFSVDGSRVFIGSFNFDPRSVDLNTEMGFVIDSPVLARQIDEAFHTRIPENAYEVRLSDGSELYWIERRNGSLIRYDTEPGMNWWQRIGIRFLSLLPIDWLL